MSESCDCLVLGGGVAGAALAILQRQRGQRVVLVERGRAHRTGPYETLLAPARSMLARTGLGALVESCAEPDPMRHGAIWGSDAVEWRQQEEPGLLLRRGDFDRRLLAAAAACGVRVLAPATARACGDAFEVDLAPGSLSLRAERVVVATGRSTRAVPDATQPAPATEVRAIAFTLVGAAAAVDLGTAVVEAVPTGWIWTHAPSTGPASAAVVVDAEQLRAEGRAALLAQALAAAKGPAGRLVDAQLAHVTDASPRLCAESPGVLRIGDAAATIDPLASQGVEKALAAADHAAAILETARQHPEWWQRLCSVHARWERGLFAAHADVARAWYRREPRFADEVFWRCRRGGEGTDAAPPAHLVVAPSLVRAPVLVREGPAFAERDGFVDRRTGDEATHVGYVPIEPLLAQFRTPCSLADAVVRAGRDHRLFVLPPRAVHGAIVELVKRGWLIAAANAAGSR